MKSTKLCVCYFRYHRVLRKEKDKKEKKRMEDLEKTDPEQFLEELKKIETDRMQVCHSFDLKYEAYSL